MKYALLIGFGLVFGISNGQQLTTKQLEKEKNKVEIYTPDEKDNLQMEFHEGVKAMNLDASTQEAYNAIILKYVSSSKRLNDKDQGYTNAEVKKKFSENIAKMNSEVKEILSPEQYVQHLENIHKITYSVNRRLESLKR